MSQAAGDHSMDKEEIKYILHNRQMHPKDFSELQFPHPAALFIGPYSHPPDHISRSPAHFSQIMRRRHHIRIRRHTVFTVSITTRGPTAL